jgi:hypothetical protein
MTKVLVNLTEDHIRNGKPIQAHACAVYLALQDAGVTPNIGVTASHLHLCAPENINCTLASVSFPSHVTEAIFDIDRNHTVEPFSFEMDIPDEYLKEKAS